MIDIILREYVYPEKWFWDVFIDGKIVAELQQQDTLLELVVKNKRKQVKDLDEAKAVIATMLEIPFVEPKKSLKARK